MKSARLLETEERFTLLQELTLQIAEADSVQEAMTRSLSSICTMTGWAFGEAWIVTGRKLDYCASSIGQAKDHDLRKFVEQGKSLNLKRGQGLPGMAWMEKAPRWVEDLSSSPSFTRHGLAAEVGFRTSVAIPITSFDQVVGVLCFFLFERTQEDLRLLGVVSTLAIHLGSLIKVKQAEEDLRKSEERTRLILDTSHEAFVSINTSGQIIDWNPAAQATFGLTKEQAIGRPLSETIIPPRYRDAHEKGLRHYLETGEGPVLNMRLELTALRAGGEEFPIELTIAPVKLGEDVTFHAFLRDVSDRKRLDAAIREAAAVLETKNQDLEAFTYSVSHDLKEPLRALEGFSQYLLGHYSDQLDARGRDLLGRISNASIRMKNLIEDLLALSRAGRETESLQLTDAHEVCREVIQSLAQLMLDRRAKVELNALPIVFVDRARLVQIFQNLLSNALKFNTNERPHVEVGLSGYDHDLAIFYVRDNGIGIDEQYHDKVFGLFQRLHTRDEFDGNGAGLAIAKRAVEARGGKIWLESELGHGTTFFFSLLSTGNKGSD